MRKQLHGVQAIYNEVVTGRYNTVVDLSDSREIREEVEVGREGCANEYRAGVVPKTAKTIMGPQALMIMRNGLEGWAISTPHAL